MTSINEAMAKQVAEAEKLANGMIKRANEKYRSTDRLSNFRIKEVKIVDLAFGDKGLSFTIHRGNNKSSIEVGEVNDFKSFDSTADLIAYLKNTKNQFTRQFKEHIQYYATTIFTAEKLVEDLKQAGEVRKDFVFRIGGK